MEGESPGVDPSPIERFLMVEVEGAPEGSIAEQPIEMLTGSLSCVIVTYSKEHATTSDVEISILDEINST